MFQIILKLPKITNILNSIFFHEKNSSPENQATKYTQNPFLQHAHFAFASVSQSGNLQAQLRAEVIDICFILKIPLIYLQFVSNH